MLLSSMLKQVKVFEWSSSAAEIAVMSLTINAKFNTHKKFKGENHLNIDLLHMYDPEFGIISLSVAHLDLY